MKSQLITSLVICAFGVTTLAGCASSRTSSPSSVAAVQSSVQSGKISAVETTALVDQTVTGSSSGSSSVVTRASGGPSLVTVQFNDGTQGKYIIENPAASHKVGESVYVVTNGDRTAIVAR